MDSLVGHRLPTYERSAAQPVAVGCASARGVIPNKSRVALGTTPRTLFPSNFMDFLPTVCSHHATASPASDAPRTPSMAGVSQRRTGNLNLNTRSRTHIACRNVTTLLNTGTQKHLHVIDIDCLSEVRLSNSGSQRIQVPQTGASSRCITVGQKTPR